MLNKQFIHLLKYVALAGNIFFILWFLYDFINTGFKLPLAVLIGLLIINSILLLGRIKPTVQELIFFLKCVAICGNVFFILFILYNGINEGFKATLVEKFRYLGLIVILTINSIFLFSKTNK